MILSKNPEVKVEGTVEELVNDVANIANALLKALKEELDDDEAKSLIRYSVEAGLSYAEGKSQSEKPEEDEQPELKEIEKAFDEFLDKCLDSVFGKN